MRSTTAAAVVFLVVTLGLTACSEGAPSDQSLGEQELSNLSELEAEYLADQFITPGELDAARDTLAACVEDAGFSVEIDPNSQGPASVVVTTSANQDDDGSKLDAAFSECYANVSAIAEVWTLQNEATPEQIEVAKAGYVDCLTAAGLVEAGLSFDDAMVTFNPQGFTADEMTAATECSDKFTQEIGDVGLPGLREALGEM
jgi:hypothetical protein